MKTLAGLLIATALFAAGDPVKGKDVFIPCSYCHDVETGVRKRGPSLKNLFLREQLANGKPVNDANVSAQIEEGGKGMPGFKESLDDAAKKALVAYLKSL